VVQSIGTDGQLFQFMVFQLNTTDLVSNDGVKNLVWIDSDHNLYEKAQYVPEVKKRVVTVSKTWEKVLKIRAFHLRWRFERWRRAVAWVLNQLKGPDAGAGLALGRVGVSDRECR